MTSRSVLGHRSLQLQAEDFLPAQAQAVPYANYDRLQHIVAVVLKDVLYQVEGTSQRGSVFLQDLGNKTKEIVGFDLREVSRYEDMNGLHPQGLCSVVSLLRLMESRTEGGLQMIFGEYHHQINFIASLPSLKSLSVEIRN